MNNTRHYLTVAGAALAALSIVAYYVGTFGLVGIPAAILVLLYGAFMALVGHWTFPFILDDIRHRRVPGISVKRGRGGRIIDVYYDGVPLRKAAAA